jgi:indolepyruvate ferredoxin oxidoreductase beta subunit
METMNFLITGVGGQGTILASDITSMVGLAAGYDVKKSDILGLAVRGGAVVGHIRWGEVVNSPIVPEGRVDYLIAFEYLEALRWLNQLKEGGALLVNQQEIHPVTVSSGFATYPDKETAEAAFEKATSNFYHVPALQKAQELGNAKAVNITMLGALSALLPVDMEIWEGAVRERVPSRFVDLNLQALNAGRQWLLDHMEA